MDWKLLGTTFMAVFVAELGDKTQLAALSFSTSGSSRWTVFFGASLALVLSTAIAVVAGESLTRVISPRTLQRGAGLLFLVLGLSVLWSTRGE